ncbi:TetR/AcrR family transcriptional regulator [Actinoplanes sp. NBRC 103695]|uniref:TetR/AcrR family transcriptional regulator n=1 Tax=Actinoplanes sp. NBRC 103695 TaxID=3032202 RepID=UPI0025568AEC|nr:TetR/AcrR family transcriptional regulator [Actinoplanes sp. NBRC 103695]
MAERAAGRRSREREDAILTAALELVSELGYGRVTTDAIAARASASKMTMYRKWPSKAVLIADALRRQSEGPAPIAADTGSLRSDLVATVDGIVRSMSGGGNLLNLADAVRDDPELRDLVRGQIYDRCDADGATLCAQAAARGEPADPALGPAVVRLAFEHVFARTLLNGQPPGPEEREAFVDAVLLPVLRGGR